MLKLIGAAMIVASAAAWGFMQADRLKKRQQELRRLVSALSFLENEIVYGKRDIKNILISAGGLHEVEIFKTAGKYVGVYSVKDSFTKAISENGTVFLGTDKEILTVLSENLGMTDCATQIKSIRHAKGLLEIAEKTAGAEYEKSGRLYRSAGALAGMAAVILLL